ncbi:hypothetical protein AB0878_44810 [Amycolatopsis sp. NPDC047767]|uniref:hypothetical protein n=1 Tax=Amycolatopsis sp. NPDC047767 TaxID=3156765 RepID=UPI0034562C30
MFTDTNAAGPSFDVKGALSLLVPKGSTGLKSGEICQGTAVYADAKLGTLVQVYDQTGKALASGVLGQGQFVENPLGAACRFDFTVRDVPDGLPNYGVEIGSHGVHTVSSIEAHSWVAIADASF